MTVRNDSAASAAEAARAKEAAREAAKRAAEAAAKKAAEAAAMNKVATGTESEKLKGLADLGKQFPTTLTNVLDKLGVKDSKLAKIATSSAALSALSTLTDEKKGVAEKAQAALQLTKAVGDI